MERSHLLPLKRELFSLEEDSKFVGLLELEWNSSFFNTAYYELSKPNFEEVDFSAVEKGFVQALVDPGDINANEFIAFLKNNNFQEVEKKLDYSKNLKAKGSKISLEVSPEILKNLEEVKSIDTSNFYKESRFYADGGFEEELIDRFYRTWLENAVKGEYDDYLLVKRERGEIQAFCSIKEFNDFARIGLFGVTKGNHGKGIGKKFLNSVEQYLREKGISELKVATQGKNIAAQKLYEKAGFKLSDEKIWFHLWI